MYRPNNPYMQGIKSDGLKWSAWNAGYSAAQYVHAFKFHKIKPEIEEAFQRGGQAWLDNEREINA